MKNIFYFLLGIALVVLTSATTARIVTMKPATPKQNIVEVFDEEYSLYSVKSFIEEKQKKGWILKQIFGYPKDKYKSDFIVVMEKY